jgi:AcrR family transcriptional regulator
MSKSNEKKSAAREKLLVTASKLFFEKGFHAVGVDTIVAESGITKMTMYKHFSSKDYLIVAILERSNELYWEWFENTIHGITEPERQLIAIFEAVAHQHTLSPQSTFCLYQAVAVEYPLSEHIINISAGNHKKSIINRLETICEQARLKSPELLAWQLFILLEGFCMSSRFIGSDGPTAEIVQAAATLIAAHR